MTSLLTLLGIIYLVEQVSTIIQRHINNYLTWRRNRQLSNKLKANHPEMKNVRLDQADLLFFSSDKEFRSIVMNNDEAGSNIAIEDDERFSIAISDVDEDLFDDD
jgi:hypothetical protein